MHVKMTRYRPTPVLPALLPVPTQSVANRNRALARRAVAEASAPGAPPLRLSALLVDPGWRSALSRELGNETTRQLEAFLHGEWAPGRKKVFPPREYIFQAFNACPFEQVGSVRVSVLTQLIGQRHMR